MKFINHKVKATQEETLSMLKNSEAVNKNVSFCKKRGKPSVTITEKNGKVRMKCEFVGGERKDGSLLGGTKFFGRVTERGEYTTVRGIVATDPIFHIALAIMCVVFVIMCIVRQGFNVVPVCLVIFDLLMYRDEFKKQGVIERYIARAVKRLDLSKKEDSDRTSN